MVVTPEMVDDAWPGCTSAGDAGAFQSFLQTNGWTEGVPRDADGRACHLGDDRPRHGRRATDDGTVRASYIQMDDAALAQSVLERARAGDDFALADKTLSTG